MALDSDLSTQARIRNAALELFASRGAAGTTIRDVAAEAGVSPGLVQHHFGTKARLREAVDEFVIETARQTLADLPESDDVEARAAEFGQRMAAVARDHPATLLYVARSVSEADEAGLAMFGGLVALGRAQLGEMSEAGVLEPGVDLDWASMHVVVLNLASLLFEPAISRVLGEPFLGDEQLERWTAATTALFQRAIQRRG